MENQLKLEETCTKCKGSGNVNSAACPNCQGKGTILTEEGKKVLNFLRSSITLSEH